MLQPFPYLLTHFFKGFLHRFFSVCQYDSVLLFEVIDNFLRFVMIGLEPFLYHLGIVVNSPAGFSSIQQSLHHAGLSALQDHDKWNYHIGMHVHVPSPKILLVPGEAVDQKFASQISFTNHLCFKQFDCNLTWNYFPLHHVLLDEFAVLGLLILPFFSQQITS